MRRLSRPRIASTRDNDSESCGCTSAFTPIAVHRRRRAPRGHLEGRRSSRAQHRPKASRLFRLTRRRAPTVTISFAVVRATCCVVAPNVALCARRRSPACIASARNDASPASGWSANAGSSCSRDARKEPAIERDFVPCVAANAITKKSEKVTLGLRLFGISRGTRTVSSPSRVRTSTSRTEKTAYRSSIVPVATFAICATAARWSVFSVSSHLVAEVAPPARFAISRSSPASAESSPVARIRRSFVGSKDGSRRFLRKSVQSFFHLSPVGRLSFA